MREIVINTGPVIALVAATGTLEWLSEIYGAIWVPYEVDKEIRAGGTELPELEAMRSAAKVIHILPPLTPVSHVLVNELDSGEASVIQTALQKNVSTVAIDEKAGRRVARLNGLKVTGSLGILVKARQRGLIDSMTHCISKLRLKGIWISDTLIQQALLAVGEGPGSADEA